MGDEARCPNCGHGLEAADLNHITVHDCPGCGGIWFARDELRRAKDNAEHGDLRWIDFDLFAAAENARPGTRACPTCGEALHVIVYPHSKVRVDVCAADHGVWLDRDEFDKIIRALDELVDRMSVAEYERAALHELAQVVHGPESHWSELRDFLAVFHLLELRLGIEHPQTAAVVDNLSRGGL